MLLWPGPPYDWQARLGAAIMVPAELTLAALSVLLAWLFIRERSARHRLLQDVQRQAAEQRDARVLALHDPLTGLLNRRGMAEAATQHLQAGRQHALLLCDLNDFKQINDSFGHPAGDEALRQFAGRLAALQAPGVRIDRVRLGGDEFVLLASTESGAFEPRAIARDLLRATETPILVGDQSIRLSASVGIATDPDAGSLDALLEIADDAMYEAKRTGLPIRSSRRDPEGSGGARRKFEQQVDLRSPDRTLYAAAIGINRLNELRRALGYGLGSKLVRDVTHRLCMLEDDFGFERLSSNVLGLTFYAADREAAQSVLDRLRARLEGPVVLAGTTVDVRLTIGFAGPGRASTLRDLTEQAQAALEQAWRVGAAAMIFDEDEQTAASDNIGLMADMRCAVAAGALAVHYQPKLRAGSGEVEGLEALVRWTHPRLGAIPPNRFIPVAEKTGDIRLLTEFVLEQAIQDQARLVAAGLRQPIYVNVSAELIGDEQFAPFMLEQLRGQDGSIGIEITETAVLSNPERALHHLQQMADAGIRIAIDDYGAGLSSLSYLKQLPATELKMDMMFISKLATSHRDPMIVRSTIELAHGLGLVVTAEGVEDEDAVALLRVMGCDLLQGFLFAHPMPLPELTSYLKNHDPAVLGARSNSFATLFANGAREAA